MFAHLETTKAVMLAGLEDPDRATKVIGAVLHRGDPMPTAPPNGKHVSSVDKNTASANVNAGRLCPTRSVRPHGKGCRRAGRTLDVGIETVAPVVVVLVSLQINYLGPFYLIFVGPLALTHNSI